ncbi:hypothetical protein PHYSODRAFT_529149 [Phytophthora sojae]|uniref:Uncharacterized protein n=1 Tax=Phytophthora sojae (strain P6497) TaxID=1094619 RepID=G5AA06_PHYSP|nr:hypothetical protein PHYSODRAFT_529149 [Phytophthora sojae]EGZ07435.1 hypothetical protein PHYSODRAFT_529149 [Phytophthora sojae]|eukprot:XP_009537001.1 hypothetical protein PHYSODRAFT_529149 [Phytophthora sojae]
MEARKDRKRKAAEVAESPEFVQAAITQLSLALTENEVKLRGEIRALCEELSGLNKQLADKSEEREMWKQDAAFLHADAVIDRARLTLWHNGDLSLLRKVIDPRTRALRNTEARGDRTLYLCESAPKKANGKAPSSSFRASDVSPKHESEEASTPARTPTESAPDTNQDDRSAEAKEDDDYVRIPVPSDKEDSAAMVPLPAGKEVPTTTMTPEQETPATDDQENPAPVQKPAYFDKNLEATEQEVAEYTLMNCGA